MAFNLKLDQNIVKTYVFLRHYSNYKEQGKGSSNQHLKWWNFEEKSIHLNGIIAISGFARGGEYQHILRVEFIVGEPWRAKSYRWPRANSLASADISANYSKSSEYKMQKAYFIMAF